ncbi:GNAT family N-acetyltransferase [Mucisphaera calidilacus]|uniref:N-acetyltransferase domain-containing protein n=1 Tax=Mucisphaera calidilacus TaxID=2527982 RepID=A0A518BV70_9BACT|nr:GNAT family N-acetyltransferase [Mucisphaera calidilacus]QDU70880.1 hypothetical protein Pan265_07210 [Mucisphaera calidilacus]
MIIEPYASHDRSAFDCGHPDLNTYAARHLGQYERNRLAKHWVAVEQPNGPITGFYAISQHALDTQSLPHRIRKRLPRHPVPCSLLGRLAVDRRHQGRHLGEILLFHAFSTVLRASREIGTFALIVDAVDDNAANFYTRYGLVPLEHNPLRLMILTQTLLQHMTA